jgi:putative endonuclease
VTDCQAVVYNPTGINTKPLKTMQIPPKPKAEHLLQGKTGEDLAAEMLLEKGWKIAARNWRGRKGELDIIAWDTDGTLVFVEVKTRSYDGFGGPENAVNKPKSKILKRTAGCYMESIQYEWAVRFDVIAIIFRHGKLHEMRHIEDVFF